MKNLKGWDAIEAYGTITSLNDVHILIKKYHNTISKYYNNEIDNDFFNVDSNTELIMKLLYLDESFKHSYLYDPYLPLYSKIMNREQLEKVISKNSKLMTILVCFGFNQFYNPKHFQISIFKDTNKFSKICEFYNYDKYVNHFISKFDIYQALS